MDNQTLLEKHFENSLNKVIHDGSDYPMFLITQGLKHAALTMNAEDDQIEAIRSFCDDFEFAMRVRSGRTSKPRDVFGGQPVDSGNCVFVADEKERFDILDESEGRFYGYSDKSVGKFLGFPKSAVEFFDSTEQPAMESRQFIEELKQNGEFGEETKYISLTTYVPAPDKKCVREAIETGKERSEKLSESEIGNRYLKHRFERSLY